MKDHSFGVDVTQYCSRCGKKRPTRYPPGDCMQICEPCFVDPARKLEMAAELEWAAENGSGSGRTDPDDVHWRHKKKRKLTISTH